MFVVTGIPRARHGNDAMTILGAPLAVVPERVFINRRNPLDRLRSGASGRVRACVAGFFLRELFLYHGTIHARSVGRFQHVLMRAGPPCWLVVFAGKVRDIFVRQSIFGEHKDPTALV